jgi:hypothetical protein
MSSKQFWKPTSMFTKFPTKGYIHFIFSDDTEMCSPCSDIESITNEKTIIMFTGVDTEYKNEFDNGGNRAIDEDYLFTSKLLQEIKAEEEAAKLLKTELEKG